MRRHVGVGWRGGIAPMLMRTTAPSSATVVKFACALPPPRSHTLPSCLIQNPSATEHRENTGATMSNRRTGGAAENGSALRFVKHAVPNAA
jgi:hypothetical protein